MITSPDNDKLKLIRRLGDARARHAFTSHILEKKSPAKKRHLGNPAILSEPDTKTVKKLLGAKTR